MIWQKVWQKCKTEAQQDWWECKSEGRKLRRRQWKSVKPSTWMWLFLVLYFMLADDYIGDVPTFLSGLLIILLWDDLWAQAQRIRAKRHTRHLAEFSPLTDKPETTVPLTEADLEEAEHVAEFLGNEWRAENGYLVHESEDLEGDRGDE